MPDILSDHEKLLLKQIAEGNEQAFAQVFHAYRDKLFAFIFRLSGSRAIAEDVVQDIFLKIWLQREELSTIEYFNAFVFRMAQNHTINLLRRLSKETLMLHNVIHKRIQEDIKLSRRNRYSLSLMDQINDLQVRPAHLIIKLAAYDHSSINDRQKRLKDIQGFVSSFDSIRKSFEDVFSKYRISGKQLITYLIRTTITI